MRTVSSQDEKGKERPRRLADDLRLLARILSMAWQRLAVGWAIRRRFRRCRQAQAKLYVEDIHLS